MKNLFLSTIINSDNPNHNLKTYISIDSNGKHLVFRYELVSSKKWTALYVLDLDLITGDFEVGVIRLFNNNVRKEIVMKKNDFSTLYELYNSSIFSIEVLKKKPETYDTFSKKFMEILGHDVVIDHTMCDIENSIYGQIIIFHLNKHSIKWHNNVFYDIVEVYPKKKYLKLNDNKFLAAVLDQLKIKNKKFISVLSNKDGEVYFNSLLFLTKLFGDNYIDYFNKFNWESFLAVPIRKTNKFTPFKKHEKDFILKSINGLISEDELLDETRLDVLAELVFHREFLLKKGFNINLKGKDFDDIIAFRSNFETIKNQIKVGYKRKYVFNKRLVDMIEEPIQIGENIFELKILKTEEDFYNEGILMKNCMKTKFQSGLTFIFVTMRNGRERINLQYRDGILFQSKGKANSEVPSKFNSAINVLTDRFKTIKNERPTLEKYDILKKE